MRCVSLWAVRQQWGGEEPPLCRCPSSSPPLPPHSHTPTPQGGRQPTTTSILLSCPYDEVPVVGGWSPGRELCVLGCASAAVASPSRPLLSPLLSPPPPPSRHKGGDTLGLPYSCSACDSAPESPLPLLSPCRQCCALGRGRLQWWREERRRQSRPSQSGPAPTQRAPGLHHNNNTHDCTQADDTNEPTLTRQSLRLAVWIWYYTIRNTDVHGKTKRLLSPPILIRFTQNSQSRLFSPSPTHFTHFVLPPTSP